MRKPLLSALVALVAALLVVPVASASAYSVDVAPRKHLAGRSSVSVTISGLPKTVGVYVRQCVKTAGRPAASQCLGGDDRSGKWALRKYPYGGKRPANTVNPAKGAFSLPIKQKFNGYNCKQVKCVVFVRRDHRNGGDYSYDRSIGLSFKN